jgi:hypothetical protein
LDLRFWWGHVARFKGCVKTLPPTTFPNKNNLSVFEKYVKKAFIFGDMIITQSLHQNRRYKYFITRDRGSVGIDWDCLGVKLI